jgi:PAS domain S-box-containing protein
MPFILFTGQGSEDVAVRAINAGVTDYLQKHPGDLPYALLAGRIRTAVADYRSAAETERSARRTEAQFELLVETVEGYAIFFLDEEGYVRTWNRGAEQIKGYTEAEIVGEHFSVFYREEDVEAGAPEHNLREARARGESSDEGWRVRKDGSEFWADVTIAVLEEAGDPVGYTKIVRDDTQRHREQLLREQNEQLEELVAAISHDLRSPLAVAEGNVELALETGDLSRLEAVREAHARVTELLDYLAALAREGSRIMDPDPVRLQEVAETAWTSVETDEATLIVAGRLTLVADRQRLEQLLQNLFANAVEHAGPDVTVRVGSLEGEEGFYVEDDGPGVPESERAEVFEMGYSSDADGSGFGLAICRQIAEAHGWFIDLTAGTDGGARFEVSDVEEE